MRINQGIHATNNDLCWRIIFRGKKRLLNTPAVSYLYLVFSGRSSTSPCLTLYLLGIQLFLYVPDLTEQSSANHTRRTTPARQHINIFFPQQRKSFVSTGSYRFVNIRLARTEYDRLQKITRKESQYLELSYTANLRRKWRFTIIT